MSDNAVSPSQLLGQSRKEKADFFMPPRPGKSVDAAKITVHEPIRPSMAGTASGDPASKED